MIKNNRPLSLAEVKDYLKKSEDSEAGFLGFINKFTNLSPKDAKELREKLGAENLIKLNETSISKIIDLMPENQETLNKIFTEVNLNEEESKRILDILDRFR